MAVGLDVSTHAPLAGSDRAVRVRDPRAVRFQPTLPLRGATPPSLPAVSSSNLFQPTLPLRGATAPCPIRDGRRPSFNPRSPCGERRAAGGMTWRRHRSFNPRSPCGERHPHDFVRPDVRLVSTHAPLAGSDSWPRGSGRAARGFNPRSPCGERLPVGSVVWGSNSFNPRSPCGERPAMPAPMPAT